MISLLKRPTFLTLIALTNVISADQLLYMQSCGACHGADGKGVGGQFPPLAKSEWIQGKPERAVQIVLKGIVGPITVGKKEFNLAMPPQGMSMKDEQIAQVLTYIRSNFGNKESAVTPEMVAKERVLTKDRAKPWTADELTKLYPLPGREPLLTNLISEVYYGKFTKMPDLDSLEPNAVEEEHSGIMDIHNVEKKDGYALRFSGEFLAKKAGEYKFTVDADDSALLSINGKLIAAVKGAGPMNGSRAKAGKVKLTEGVHKFQTDFVEFSGLEGLAVKVEGPGVAPNTYLTPKPKGGIKKKRTWPPIMLEPKNGRVALYRNFISGSSARGLGVGYPEGVNLAYSTDDFNVSVVWKDQFMNAGRHWTNRGQGYEPPAGKGIVNLGKARAFALLDNAYDKWPGGSYFQKELNARFRGYRLVGEAGRPEFLYDIAGGKVVDSIIPSSNSLIRVLTPEKPFTADKPLHLRIVQGSPVKALEGGVFQVAEKLMIKVEGAKISSKPKELIATFEDSQPITISYTWK